ncbi:hypothetical protein HMPREF2999_06080 [Rothia sp. HMSC066H02]|uniref:hypothetical protein n=1 Tax=unclassified Rothia (in: high G+C Gram-positive bacteria) TaxID=2689056 RepID=UPI0008A344DF|nr:MULTISPECIES: hypothetical protein [unclassified Rothia (in: high G+C Gram-positive bacteria)]OFO96927.1 hypothetical protein HMPREF3008_08690 [Rothia sp. HMSC065D09]OFP13425.1 hypothetical protein HMPREF2999_06080 [Rothia sp. HMSC066H02]
MAQNEQNWDRENADDQLNKQVTPWSQRAFADDAVEDPAGESAGESAGDSAVEEGSLSFSDAPAEDLEDDLLGDLEDGIAHDFADGFDDDSSILPGYTPVWARIALEYGEHSAELAGDLVYSSESDDPAVDDVAATILNLIREARSMHDEVKAEDPDTQRAWNDRTRVDRLAAALESEEWTVDKLTGMWDDAPAPAGTGESDSPEYLRAQDEERTAEKQRNERIEQTMELEEKIQRRRIMARSTTDEELIAALIEATAASPELIAYEMGEHQVQLYVLCAVDDEGYMNVLEVADGHLHVGTPVEDYVAQLVDQLPVTGAALEGEATVWEDLPGEQGELEFLVDGDAAMLVDLPIDMITGLLLAYLPAGTRQVVAAPAGEWTLISADPVDLMALLGLLNCNALIAEGNANQQHLVVYEEPAREPYPDEGWYLEAFGEPYENIVEEFTWQRVPKRLNRALSREEVARFGGVLEDLLSELPGSAPELSGSKIFGSDEEEIEQGIANVMAMFGVEADSITGRRLNAYLRDTSNTLALESVLQLLDVPTELALVPTTGFDVASISTARIFGNEDEGFAQPAAEPADEAQTSEALDVTFPLDDSAAEATFSESTPVEDDSFEDDEEIEPYPGNFPSPMERSYRLVATGRRVTLAEWMDAISEGHIPFEYTHMSFTEDALDEEEDFLDSEAFDDFEGPYEQDRDFDRDDADQPVGRRVFTPEEEEAALAHLRASLAPHSAKSATEQSAASRSEVTPAEDAQSDAARSDDAQSENVSAEDAPSQVTQAAPSAGFASKKSALEKRLTPEQIRAKTRRVGLVLGADVTAQSAIALTLANVARRRRAQGKASRKFSVAAALFALNATVESALIPTVLRSFEQTQMKKHARPVADAELVHPGDTAGEHPSTKKRTLIDDLREGHYRTVEDAAPSTEQAPSGLRERALGIVRSIRQRAAKKTDR